MFDDQHDYYERLPLYGISDEDAKRLHELSLQDQNTAEDYASGNILEQDLQPTQETLEPLDLDFEIARKDSKSRLGKVAVDASKNNSLKSKQHELLDWLNSIETKEPNRTLNWS